MNSKRTLFLLLAVLSLIACLVPPGLYFIGNISEVVFMRAFLITSIIYFIFAVLWNRSRSDGPAAEDSVPLSD